LSTEREREPGELEVSLPLCRDLLWGWSEAAERQWYTVCSEGEEEGSDSQYRHITQEKSKAILF